MENEHDQPTNGTGPERVTDLPLAERAQYTIDDLRALELGYQQQYQRVESLKRELQVAAKELEMTEAAIMYGRMILGGKMPSQQAQGPTAEEVARMQADKRRRDRNTRRAQTREPQKTG